jgi:hypothetical protein
MSFIENINTDIGVLKDGITELHDRAKKQVTSFIQKSGSSYTELLNILKRDEQFEDSFVDGSKVAALDQLSYDRDGWTNSFIANEVKFLPEYYTSVTYPMVMDGGRIIPGSDFSDIFLDREGFWGYMKDDELPVTTEFTVTFYLNRGETNKEANRVYLRTNNIVTVEAFYRTTYGDEWISLGTREGRHHLWTASFSGVEIKFQAITSMFAVSFLAVCKATYATSASLTSTYYEITDLRKLKIDMDNDIPLGTAIRPFVHITNTDSSTIAESGWVEWNDDEIVTLAATEIEAPVESGFLIPSGYIEDSIVIRKGYREWEELSTMDYPLVTESVDRLATNYLDLPTGYLVMQGGVKAIFHGNGETRTEFERNEDYTVTYDTDLDTILINTIPGGRLDGMVEQPTAEVILRKPVPVIQRRTFVYLENDSYILMSIPTAGITLRTLHIGDSIENENTIQDITMGEYTISGKAGLTLIEVEGYSDINPPMIISVYDYFSSRYWLRESDSMPPETNEYYLEPAESGYKLVTPDTNLFLRYLNPTENNFVALHFEFEGTENIAPLLRGYKLINTIDKI